ncbi:MAG TPA: hypothetical protein VFF60_02960 [Candidatus Binatus sp.]|nr:hypothetical protein [Candidatus Binatus sp.]
MEGGTQSVTVTTRANAEEAARALFPTFIRQRTTIVYFILGVLVIGGVVAGFIWLLSGLGISAFWPLFVIIGAIGIGLLPWRFFVAFRRRLGLRLSERPGGETVTFSTTGMDSQSAHASAHVDWAAIKSARTTQLGLVLQLGRSVVYISKSDFTSIDEYRRALALIASGLGQRANLR